MQIYLAALRDFVIHILISFKGVTRYLQKIKKRHITRSLSGNFKISIRYRKGWKISIRNIHCHLTAVHLSLRFKEASRISCDFQLSDGRERVCSAGRFCPT